MSKSYDSVYLKNYRKRNPQKQEQWRISSEIRHLESCGYIVRKKQPEEMTVEELESHIEKEISQTRESQRKWKQRNKEHLREYYRQYRKAHPRKCKVSPEKRREYAARWRAKHREEIREYQRKWYADHKEQAKEQQRTWNAKNPHYKQLRQQRYRDALEQARIRRDGHAEQKGVSENG